MSIKFLLIFSFLLVFISGLPSVAEGAGASLFFYPGSESFIVEDTFSVEVKVDTIDIPINAAETTIYFPQDKLEVLNISKENSIFTFWPGEPEFSNSTGEISFSGGIPRPGFKKVGNIITLNFKAKKEGPVLLTFDEGRILADDGKGTNILVFIKEAKYFIQKTIAFSEEKSKVQSGEIPFPPQITCPTHPQEEWYNNNSPRFQWEIESDIIGASFILNRDSTTIPDTNSEGRIQSKIYENVLCSPSPKKALA